MFFICCTDKPRITYSQFFPQVNKPGNHLVTVSFSFHTSFLRRFLDLQSVFVCSCREKHLIPKKPVISGKDIRENCRIGMTDMGFIIYIINGSCYIKSTQAFFSSFRNISSYSIELIYFVKELLEINISVFFSSSSKLPLDMLPPGIELIKTVP